MDYQDFFFAKIEISPSRESLFAVIDDLINNLHFTRWDFLIFLQARKRKN